MEPGDELYFFVRASDNAPDNPHTTQSPTYTLRLPGPDAESLDSTALPSMVKPENLRSQRQIIIDTEQLVADLQANPKMPASTLRSRSEGIAADQAALRLRYGQFLGEESSLFGDEHGHGGAGHEEEHKEDGHKEGGHAEEEHHGGSAKMGSEVEAMHRFGHVHDQEDNATIFDPQTKAILKRALSAMWDAEKSLRAISPKPALPPEYKALDAIKELQAAERVYLHRTAFVPPALKEEKRMSGDIVGAMSYKRAQGAASDSVPAEVRELVRALAGEGALPALWSKSARDTIAARITDQEQKLSAQRAVQDVTDGCVPCRAELRAWLRGTLTDAPVLLQARPSVGDPFVQAWRGKESAMSGVVVSIMDIATVDADMLAVPALALAAALASAVLLGLKRQWINALLVTVGAAALAIALADIRLPAKGGDIGRRHRCRRPNQRGDVTRHTWCRRRFPERGWTARGRVA